MRSCVYCKRRYHIDNEISFHKFPKDYEEMKVWLKNMKINNWTPKGYDSLCSLHFDDECFNEHFSRRTLKPGSIPTKFEGTSTFSSLALKSVVKSSLTCHLSTPKSDSILCSSSVKQEKLDHADTTELTSKSPLDQGNLIDHNYRASLTPKKAIIKYGLLHDHRYENTKRSSNKVTCQTKSSLQFSKARVKYLNRHVKRLKLKVDKLKSVIKDLVKKNKILERCIYR